jgi:hypothetical protein
VIDPLAERDERIAEGGLADVADDGGGNFLIRHGPPGNGEANLGKTFVLESEAKLAEILAGQLLRPGDDGNEGGDLIALGIDEIFERFEVVLGFVHFSVALDDGDEFVFVVGDVDGNGGTVILSI